MIFKCLCIEEPDPRFLRLDERYEGRLLEAPEILRYARSPEYELDAGLVRRALEAKDECFAICHGDTIAAYGWYSRATNYFVSDTLRFHFDPQWVYMYGGFTHPDYRGQRLHAIGMTMALQRWLARGAKGIVSTVESWNEASLKSCYRMGYREFGTIYEVRVGRLLGIHHPKSRFLRRHLVYHTRGCAAYGFWLEALAPKGAPETARASAATVLGKPSRLA